MSALSQLKQLRILTKLTFLLCKAWLRRAPACQVQLQGCSELLKAWEARSVVPRRLCSPSPTFSAIHSPEHCVPSANRSHSGYFTRRDLTQGYGFIGDKQVQTSSRGRGEPRGLVRAENHQRLVEAGTLVVLCGGSRDPEGGTFRQELQS